MGCAGPRSEQPHRSASLLCPDSQKRHGCNQDTEQHHDVWAVLTRSFHDIPAEMRPSRDNGNHQECDSQRVERQHSQHRPTPALQLQDCSPIPCAFLLPCPHRPLCRICLRFGSQTSHEPGVEVHPCVEASEERPQVLVEFGIRCAHAVALILPAAALSWARARCNNVFTVPTGIANIVATSSWDCPSM